MPPTLTAHTATTHGTQARGSAIGTIKLWEIASPIAISAGILTDVLLIEVPDGLAMGLEWELTGADGIELIEVARSDDGSTWDTFYTKVLNPDVAPNSSGSNKRFLDIHGWNSRYIRVRATSKSGGGGTSVKITATDSIFTSGRFSYVDLLVSTATVEQNFADRQAHVYAEGELYDASVQATEQVSSPLVVATELRKFDLELVLILTGWTALTTLTLRPEVYVNGAWHGLSTIKIDPGKITVTTALVLEITGITANFDNTVSLGTPITAEQVRIGITGNVADGSLNLYAIAKVPY